jgi:hypothetical protein
MYFIVVAVWLAGQQVTELKIDIGYDDEAACQKAWTEQRAGLTKHFRTMQKQQKQKQKIDLQGECVFTLMNGQKS